MNLLNIKISWLIIFMAILLVSCNKTNDNSNQVYNTSKKIEDIYSGIKELKSQLWENYDCEIVARKSECEYVYKKAIWKEIKVLFGWIYMSNWMDLVCSEDWIIRDSWEDISYADWDYPVWICYWYKTISK